MTYEMADITLHRGIQLLRMCFVLVMTTLAEYALCEGDTRYYATRNEYAARNAKPATTFVRLRGRTATQRFRVSCLCSETLRSSEWPGQCWPTPGPGDCFSFPAC